ncbi:replication initiation protein [Bacillus sp. Marseille-P3800]|uniref:replication initiation protein n=1 Tax=Bacillus sp. Marseille-P3800 TaxID=2014782 RepID=UPI000C079818|nr:replication initiation protein [Bacillus sp. Marseille-P3800]
MTVTTLSLDNIVSQANQLINSPQYLTIHEKRIIWMLASVIDESDSSFRSHTFKVEDIARNLDVKTRNLYKAVETTIDSLIDKSFIIDDNGDKVKAGWLSSARYLKNKGMVRLEFSAELAPFLLLLKESGVDHTSFKLKNVLSLRSKYSGKMYELLKQYEGKSSPQIKVDELRKLLGVPDDVFPLYAKVKEKVIVKAQNDLKERTDIQFDFEQIKVGRKVESIIFHVNTNNSLEPPILMSEPDDDINRIAIN